MRPFLDMISSSNSTSHGLSITFREEKEHGVGLGGSVTSGGASKTRSTQKKVLRASKPRSRNLLRR